jgi:hypothetical protein
MLCSSNKSKLTAVSPKKYSLALCKKVFVINPWQHNFDVTITLQTKFTTMKKIQITLLIVLAGLFTIAMNSCKKTELQDPKARIINNGTQKASVQIKTTNGNTVNINNVDPNTSSAYSSYAAGQVTFTITVSNNNYVKTLDIGKGYNYDIAIDATNNITSIAVHQ